MTTSRFELLYVGDKDDARSPLAAAVTRRIAALEEGVVWSVGSAGTDAVPGHPARPEALRAATTVGVELAGHEATRLSPEDCTRPDLILAMSWDQVTRIWSTVPGAWDRVFTVKEFVHWARRAPLRPPIIFPDKVSQMRDKVAQAHAVRKRARADHGFWGGMRPQDFNLMEPDGKGPEAWEALARALYALSTDVVTLLRPAPPPEVVPLGGRTPPHRRTRARR